MIATRVTGMTVTVIVMAAIEIEAAIGNGVIGTEAEIGQEGREMLTET